jgi:hypothetical protein
MRNRVFAALTAIVLALGFSAQSEANAFGCWGHRCPPAGWGQVRTVTHWGYYPRYHHVYRTHYATDPYAYSYEPRGYYPYYNSGYWRSAREMRLRRAHAYTYAPHVPYYKAWGANRRGYNHRKWHCREHGRLRHHHY